MKKFVVCFAGLALFCMVCAVGVKGVFAQGYPSKPIRIMVGYPPGGTTDIRARLIARKLSESWGQPVVVENKPGADAAIAIEAAAKAAPDGYTLITVVTGSTAIHPNIYKKVKYDIAKDFAPVIHLTNMIICMSVNPSLPAKSMNEVVALAKAKPGQLNYAYSIADFYLAGEIFKLKTGINIRGIPYSGGAAALTALISNEVPLMFSTETQILSQVKVGTVRPIVVFSEKRSPSMPDVPTMAESGFPGMQPALWSGLLVPAKTPKEIIKKLNTEINRILIMPDVKDILTKSQDIAVGGTPEAFDTLIKSQFSQYKQWIKEAKIPLID